MAFLARIRSSVARLYRTVFARASSVLRSLRKSRSPLSDRLLSDALRITAIPSPTTREEQRAAFVLERLNSLGIPSRVDEDGNIAARLTCPAPDDSRPILLAADLSSPRWHPLESLSRLDADRARGAGLSDALGVAMLLSVAEAMLSGLVAGHKDVLLLFTVRPLDDPRSETFRRIAEDAQDRPLAALVVRGLSLGTVATKPLGTYRIEVKIRTDLENPEGAGKPGSAVDATVSLARALSGVTWDAEKMTTCRIRRVEAGAGFGREPTEGILDIELESSSEAVLELAMKAAVATAESKCREANARAQVTIVGHVPVGDPGVGAALGRLVTQALRDQHIRIREENEADPASFFSSLGIPAISVPIATGREGLIHDEIETSSIEKGRKLLLSVLERVAAGVV